MTSTEFDKVRERALEAYRAARDAALHRLETATEPTERRWAWNALLEAQQVYDASVAPAWLEHRAACRKQEQK